MTPWPEFEVFLSEQAHFDLLDELADEPAEIRAHVLRARSAQARSSLMPAGHRAPAGVPGGQPRETADPRFHESAAFPPSAAATPWAFGHSSGPVSLARGVLLLRGPADCHAGEAGARLIDGFRWCHWCLHGPEDVT